MPRRRNAAQWLAGCIIALLALTSAMTVSAAQAPPAATATSIKAAYLYQFASYVEWPDTAFKDPREPLTIGVYGDNELADKLRSITENRTVNGRRVKVRTVDRGERLDGVHILFVGPDYVDALADLADLASEHSVLVVTDHGDALRLGSVINFRPVGPRIRFEVSLDAAHRNHLQLSSRLLAVAERVEPRHQ